MRVEVAVLGGSRCSNERCGLAVRALGWYAEGPRFESASALHSFQKLWSVDTVLWR